MKFIFFDTNPEIVEAYRESFKSIDFGEPVTRRSIIYEEQKLEFHAGSFTDFSCQSIVSPANSFGFMRGGIDLAYRKFFGKNIQTRVQDAIKSFKSGELLVGDAISVPTNSTVFPNLLVAPTMRVPADVSDTINAYLAIQAVLRCAQEHMIAAIAIPGMATGAGKMTPKNCALQVKMAVQEFFNKPEFPRSLSEASLRQQTLQGGPNVHQ